ncbi:PRP31 [Candida theae]|uniref:PRP31 n=1 Tax=Candida theae TaxID=1198502 RepID=A0AAD5FYL5_9ASCO|nr:PRP31 [Candida theae]KAI5958214.1 PRP31 [Candida theae]
MTDYERQLLEDLGSSDEEVNDHNDYRSGDSLQAMLADLIAFNATNSPFQVVLEHPNIESVADFVSLSKVFPLIPALKAKFKEQADEDEVDYMELLAEIGNDSEYQSNEYKFIVTINELSSIINNEILAFTMLLKMQYKLVFPELENLVRNNIDYARIAMIIEQDLANIKRYESELKRLMTNDKVLLITISALQQSRDEFKLSEEDFNKVKSCALLVLELDEVLQQLSKFISDKLAKFAPNVSAIIGPITTSQLLIATGSLKQFALTPSCNIPALGVRDLASNTKTASRSIRQTGYIYHCDLVKYLPPEIQKSVMRIISGKVILAARIDLAKSSSDGSLGTKLRSEIEGKIDKLLAPPDQVPNKALPAPIEIKSKKRGGRRIRKMKERFQMSDLRKAQNKMEFGKQEETIMDDFGEEIGLGMSRSGGGNRLGQIQVNKNTDARMSKAMAERLNKQKQTIDNFWDEDFDSIILSKPKEEPVKTESESRWLGTQMKNNARSNEPAEKKRKLES